MSYLSSKVDEGPAIVAGPSVSSGVSPRMRWVRGGLSVFIVFHLFSVLIGPIGDSNVGMRVAGVVTPYLYLFEMTNAWNFFSPNPEPPIYIEFELVDSTGATLRRSQWPDSTNPFFLRERQNRRISATDFMISSELKTEKMMVPYLCHQESRTVSVRLWRVMYTFPSASDVVSGKRHLGDDVGMERKLVGNAFCEGAAG